MHIFVLLLFLCRKMNLRALIKSLYIFFSSCVDCLSLSKNAASCTNRPSLSSPARYVIRDRFVYLERGNRLGDLVCKDRVFFIVFFVIHKLKKCPARPSATRFPNSSAPVHHIVRRSRSRSACQRAADSVLAEDTSVRSDAQSPATRCRAIVIVPDARPKNVAPTARCTPYRDYILRNSVGT